MNEERRSALGAAIDAGEGPCAIWTAPWYG